MHAPGLRGLIIALQSQFPGERFDIVAHSMGGVVALYAAAVYPDVRGSLHSITTINSPVRGIGELREIIGEIALDCTGIFEDAIDDLDNSSPVITTINQFPWNSESHDSLWVATIANECDIVVTTVTRYPGGDLGVLPTADFTDTFIADTDGCPKFDPLNPIVSIASYIADLQYQHRSPLLVGSNATAEPTIGALFTSLVLHDQAELFIGRAPGLLRTKMTPPVLPGGLSATPKRLARDREVVGWAERISGNLDTNLVKSR